MAPTGSDPGDGPATATAAAGYWRRRGLPTDPGQVAAAPGAPLLLLAVLAVTGGSVLLPRPGAVWHAAQPRLLGQPVHPVPLPAECGGVPDPVAVLETVRRLRADGEDPRTLVLSVADACTGTAAPPELLHEVCEAAMGEELLVVSDETWRDTAHDPQATVVVGPAEMPFLGPRGDRVVVLAALDGVLLPSDGPAGRVGVARFPGTTGGRGFGAAVREVLAVLRARLSPRADEAAAAVLDEPEPVRLRRAAAAGAHGELAAALHRACADAGALCRPPRVARGLYVDLEPLRARLAARGVTDAAGLEAALVARVGPHAVGGHRFGDDPRALRVRLGTDVLEAGPRGRAPAGTGAAPPEPPAGDPLRAPGAAEALRAVRSALVELTAYGGER